MCTRYSLPNDFVEWWSANIKENHSFPSNKWFYRFCFFFLSFFFSLFQQEIHRWVFVVLLIDLWSDFFSSICVKRKRKWKHSECDGAMKVDWTTELNNKWHRFYECTFSFFCLVFQFVFYYTFLCSCQKIYCESIKRQK